MVCDRDEEGAASVSVVACCDGDEEGGESSKRFQYWTIAMVYYLR